MALFPMETGQEFVIQNIPAEGKEIGQSVRRRGKNFLPWQLHEPTPAKNNCSKTCSIGSGPFPDGEKSLLERRRWVIPFGVPEAGKRGACLV
jgi:hypothetical protein